MIASHDRLNESFDKIPETHAPRRARVWALTAMISIMSFAPAFAPRAAGAAEPNPTTQTLALTARAEQKAQRLREKLEACRAAGQDIAVPDAALAVAELFCRYARHDAADAELRPAALRAITYVDRMLDAELAKAQDALTGKAHYPRIPQWRTVGVKYHDGGLWSGDEPVFLSGFNWDAGQADRDPALMKRLGVNLVDGMLNGSMTREGKFRDDWFSQGPRPYLDRMARAGFPVDCLLDATPPRWLIEAHPELTARGYGHYRNDIFDHPLEAEYRAKFLDHFVPLYAAQPALFAVDLANEPAFQGPSPLMLENWRAWLRRKYGDLPGLNRAWGLTLKSFDEITRYPSMGEPMKSEWDRARVRFEQPGVRAMHYDWCAFNNERVSDYFRSMAERIHARAPGAATHVKVMMVNFLTGGAESRGWGLGLSYHTFGIDPEALAQCCDLLGCDLDLVDLAQVKKPSRFYGSVPYVNGWLNAGLAADLLKSLAPEKPLYNSELHAVERVDETDISPSAKEHIETALWLAHLHGMNANLLWYWGRGADGGVMGHGREWFQGSLLQQPWILQGYAQESLRLRRFVRPVMAFAREARPVRLLYSEASAIQDVGYLDALRDAYEALNFLGVSIGLVTERQLAADEGLAGTRLLIVPNAKYVQDGTVAALRAAQAKGVMIGVIGGESLSATPTGAPCKDSIIQGAKTIPLAAPQAYHPQFDAWLKAAGGERELLALDAAGRAAWGVETRTAREGGRRLAYLVNLLREPVTVTLQWRAADAQLRNWRADAEPAVGRVVTLQPRQVIFGAY